jgi:hypothetical protein
VKLVAICGGAANEWADMRRARQAVDLAGTLTLEARSTLARSPGGAVSLAAIAIGQVDLHEVLGRATEKRSDARIYNKVIAVKRHIYTIFVPIPVKTRFEVPNEQLLEHVR